MAKANLISDDDDDNKRQYQIHDGRIITLIYDEGIQTITFEEDDNRIFGEFVFINEEIDEEGFGEGNRYLLQRLYSPIPNTGLGRAAIEFFIDMTDASVYAREHDGITRDDASHLTGDAHNFISKMQEEGLIERYD